MRTYNIAVIEDNDREYESTESHLTRFAGEKGLEFRVARYRNAEMFLNNYRPSHDIVLMDIMLPGMNGMAAARRLREYDPNVLLIFLTNMSGYAIRGYEVNALGYVMKPATYYGLAMYLQTAVNRIDTSNDPVTYIRSRTETTVLSVREIYYIEIVDHDMVFHTVNGEIRAYGSLNEREAELKKADFARCNSYTLVNLKYLEALYPEDVTVKGKTFRITRSKKKEFLEAVSSYLGRR